MQHGQLESDTLVRWGMKDRTPWVWIEAPLGARSSLVGQAHLTDKGQSAAEHGAI